MQVLPSLNGSPLRGYVARLFARDIARDRLSQDAVRHGSESEACPGLEPLEPRLLLSATSLAGTVFDDANGNGIQDASESGLQSWDVDLTTHSLTDATDSNGDYLFAGLEADEFTIQPQLQAGWDWTLPSNGTITIATDVAETGLDFGVHQGSVTYLVSTDVDEDDGDYSHGDLSLREALALAAAHTGDDVIQFDPAAFSADGTLSLTLGELLIDSNVDIQGLGAGQLAIDAQGSSRVFSVLAGVTATIDGLTITGGDAGAGDGGGILTLGTLTVLNSVISNNRANAGGGIHHGDQNENSVLVLQDSTVSGNTADVWGGGIWANSFVTISNTTISGNDSLISVGGVLLTGPGLTITNSTITNNRADSDSDTGPVGGIVGGLAVFDTTTLHNTIVAGNFSGAVGVDVADDLFGSAFDPASSHNLLGVIDPNATGLDDPSNLLIGSGDPMLAPLGDNGGPTPTHALLIGSLAIDAGDNALAAGPFDQRGPGFDRVIGASVDIGAVEYRLRFQENSSILGGANLARTKDADIADINNDGLPDIFDANSNNNHNGTDLVIRFNNGAGGFIAQTVEVNDNVVTYDADLVDLNGDGFPDLIRTEVGEVHRIAVYFNRQGNQGVWFDLSSPDFIHTPGGSPDDIEVGDIDGDGHPDFAVAQRFSGGVTVYLNDANGTGDFTSRDPISFSAPGSTHDVFLLDVENDGDLDIFAVKESFGANSLLWINNGEATPSFSDSGQLFSRAYSGSSADFNGDDRDDFVLGGNGEVTVYLNDPLSPGQFTTSTLGNTAGAGLFYDLELGDIDNDGDFDIIGVTINGGGGDVRIWLNDGDGGFSSFGGTTPLPGFAGNQSLSADLIDYDLDGDLDLYITGGDSQGAIPNQLFENLLSPSLTVSTLVDEDDGDFSSGDLSLREALGLAAGSEAGQIDFNSGLLGGTIVLSLGELLIDSDVAIEGLGADQLTVSGGNLSRVFRLGSGVAASISGLTLADGNAGAGNGGGVFNAGQLILNTVEVRNNTANAGGGIYNDTTGTLTVQDNTTISNNTAAVFGGGIRNAAGASLTIEDSSILSNSALFGGGIRNEGNLTISRSTIDGNSASSRGGIYNASTGTLVLSDSAVTNNTANGVGGIGAAGTVTILNTTISGNSATGSTGGVFQSAGSSLTIINSTITDNRADSDGDGGGEIGGISSSGTAILHNTIVAKNFFGTGNTPDDVFGTFDSSSSHNLIGAIDGSTDLDGNNTLFGTLLSPLDPLLGSLADNGGPTMTHALLTGSAAIDAGDNSFAPLLGLWDQRGDPFSRLVDGDDDQVVTIDIGAYEFVA